MLLLDNYLPDYWQGNMVIPCNSDTSEQTSPCPYTANQLNFCVFEFCDINVSIGEKNPKPLSITQNPQTWKHSIPDQAIPYLFYLTIHYQATHEFISSQV